MRIWDIHPGYLNRQSLLGEHRELHGIVSIIRENKKGYSKHPETLRWVGYGWALQQRHKLLKAEMNLRGYKERTPVLLRSKPEMWPESYVDYPASQVAILKKKYRTLERGRIPLPKNAQDLWAHHKYSVMARNIGTYKDMGNQVSSRTGSMEMHTVALELCSILRAPPKKNLIKNTLLHMWGYVSQYSSVSGKELGLLSVQILLNKIRQLSLLHNVKYMVESTALSELGAWKIS